jgi:hypothetical protein
LWAKISAVAMYSSPSGAPPFESFEPLVEQCQAISPVVPCAMWFFTQAHRRSNSVCLSSWTAVIMP